MALCRAGTSQLGEVGLSAVLKVGSPQANTNIVSSTHGTQADTTVRRSSGAPAEANSSSSCVYRHFTAGCQTRRSSARLTSDTTPAITSTSHGPWKLETANWAAAKLPPATRIA